MSASANHESSQRLTKAPERLRRAHRVAQNTAKVSW